MGLIREEIWVDVLSMSRLELIELSEWNTWTLFANG